MLFFTFIRIIFALYNDQVMISIVVCSIHPEKLKNFQENVLETIGVPCEFIVHDNRETAYSITHVYNFCAEKAKYEYICFSHEDVSFCTKNWGDSLINLLKQPDTGVVGFAGSSYKSATYSGWESRKKFTRYNFVQYFKNGNIKHCISNPQNLSASPVVVLDGMCLCMRTSVWREFYFDEDTFKGFHLYDLDISMSVGQKYTNYVTNEILVTHFSEGSYTKEWVDDTVLFHKKWSLCLPAYVHMPSKMESIINEIKISFRFIRMLMKRRIGNRSFIESCCRNHFRCYFWHPTSLKLLQRLCKYERQWRREGLL